MIRIFINQRNLIIILYAPLKIEVQGDNVFKETELIGENWKQDASISSILATRQYVQVEGEMLKVTPKKL